MDKIESALRAEIEWHRKMMNGYGKRTVSHARHRDRLRFLEAALPAPDSPARCPYDGSYEDPNFDVPCPVCGDVAKEFGGVYANPDGVQRCLTALAFKKEWESRNKATQ